MTQIEDKIYIKYAQDIVDGNIAACENIILACKRFLSWFERDDMYFDYADVDQKIRFVAKMKHSTGIHNRQPFILLPWQQWCFASIFGWKWTSNNLRVTENVMMFMARKNGKTATCAAIALVAAVCDKEASPEIEFVANNSQQAAIGFTQTKDYAESLDPKKKIFKRFRSEIRIPPVKGTIKVLASDSMGLDGYNSSLFILDEMHAQRNWDLYNVLRSSQGMRQQPLAIVITTAGFLLNGYPCYEMRQTCTEILRGLKQDDSFFAALYELDEDDDWKDESTWIKANPSLGQTVRYEYLRGQVQQATNNTSLEIGVKTKNFNMFCQSADVWITDTYIQNNSQRIDVSKLIGEYAYMGVDLSAISDLTCTSVMFPPNKFREYYPDKYIFKTFVYIPEEAFETSINAELYKQWKRQGYVTMTSGNVVDYDYILLDQKQVMQDTTLQGVYYDNWNATQWAINATNEGLPLEPYSQALGNFNKPTKLFEMLIKSGKVIIDDSPCVRSCFGNVELKTDWNENCKPIKSAGDKNKKIDPVISMLEALGGYLNSPHYQPEVFTL